jgi:hypothetical protein
VLPLLQLPPLELDPHHATSQDCLHSRQSLAELLNRKQPVSSC